MDLSQRSELTQSVDKSSGSFELVIGAALVSLIGLGIDRWLGTLPIFTLLFACVGFVGAACSLYYRYKAQMASLDEGNSAAGLATRSSRQVAS